MGKAPAIAPADAEGSAIRGRWATRPFHSATPKLASPSSAEVLAVYLLDTNVVSETRKARPHGGVMAWLADVDGRDLYISAVTLGEIQAGAEFTKEQDPAKAAEIEKFIDRIVAALNVLPMTTETFRLWAKLMHRKSNLLANDAMIAATAKVHRLTVVTRNVKDFREFGVALLNPFAAR